MGKTPQCGGHTDKVRRMLLTAGGSLAFLFGAGRAHAAAAPPADAGPILQPRTQDGKAFMDRALEMRRLAVAYGDQPYGAAVVRDNIIVGQSWSRVVLDRDPTGHAEMAAIRDAARRLNSRDLGGAILYSSSRPCPMCEAAAYWANIGRMIHGADAHDAGAPTLCG